MGLKLEASNSDLRIFGLRRGCCFAPVDAFQFAAADQPGFRSWEIELVEIQNQVGVDPLMEEQLVALGGPHDWEEDRSAGSGGEEAALGGEQLSGSGSVRLDGETLCACRIEKGDDLARGRPGGIRSIRESGHGAVLHIKEGDGAAGPGWRFASRRLGFYRQLALRLAPGGRGLGRDGEDLMAEKKRSMSEARISPGGDVGKIKVAL